MCNKNPMGGYEELCFLCLAVADPPSRRTQVTENIAAYYLFETSELDDLESIFGNQDDGVELKVDLEGFNYE
jgi:hypothetical protein